MVNDIKAPAPPATWPHRPGQYLCGPRPREEVSTGGLPGHILTTLYRQLGNNAARSRKRGRYVMSRHSLSFVSFMMMVAVIASAIGVQAGEPQDRDRTITDIPDSWGLATVTGWLKNNKAVVELADASIIIEVNSTDGDAGFQIFLDGEGWSHVRVYDSNGYRIFKATASGGVRHIGGGTELFIESSEPEYEDLEGMQDLIELLPEGEYFFVARTTDNNWATGTAELTHDVPAGPEILNPPVLAEGCTEVDAEAPLVIEWEPVESDIWGETEIEIEAYQVIVESETEDGPEVAFSATLPPSEDDANMVTVPPEALFAGVKYAFEVLAIEESGNQTITESCFETAE